MQVTRSYTWFPLSLLWFGAAMSVAEIHTGGLTAAAGLKPGLAAVLAGHLLGAALLGMMGYIGFREGQPSLMCTRIAFGRRGSWLLSLANVIQLLGWTTVMIQLNSQAVSGITRTLWGVEITRPAIIVLGCLIALWAFWETQGKHTGNTVAVIMLALLAVLVTYTLWAKAGGGAPFGGNVPVEGGVSAGSGASRPSAALMPFGDALELSIIMPLSWVPLVADYASRAKSVRTACLAPAFGYFIGSVWMYCLGFFGALLTGESSPTPMLLAAGLGVAALSVLVLSTIATTFLDVYSAVASARNVFPALPEKRAGLAVVVIGTCAALIWNSELYMNFLLLIGAVFAPLSAIMFTDYFVLKRDEREKAVSVPSVISLGVGFGSHMLFSAWGGSPVGPTLSCLALTFVVHVTLRLAWRSGTAEDTVLKPR